MSRPALPSAARHHAPFVLLTRTCQLASLPHAGVFGRACNCVGSDGSAKEGVIQEAERLRETLVEKLADIRSSTAATSGSGDSDDLGQFDATGAWTGSVATGGVSQVAQVLG